LRLPEFKGIIKSIEENSSDWVLVFKKGNLMNVKLPGEW